MLNNQKGLISILAVLILLAGLAVGVFLVQRQTSLKSKASLDSSRIEIVGPSILGDHATSRNVRARLVYVPPVSSPTPQSSSTPSPTAEPSPSQDATMTLCFAPQILVQEG